MLKFEAKDYYENDVEIQVTKTVNSGAYVTLAKGYNSFADAYLDKEEAVKLAKYIMEVCNE